jgi:hypothetical protein
MLLTNVVNTMDMNANLHTPHRPTRKTANDRTTPPKLAEPRVMRDNFISIDSFMFWLIIIPVATVATDGVFITLIYDAMDDRPYDHYSCRNYHRQRWFSILSSQ